MKACSQLLRLWSARVQQPFGRLRHAPSRMRIRSLASVLIAAGLKTSESLHVHADVKIFGRRLHLTGSCKAYLRASIARLQRENAKTSGRKRCRLYILTRL
jgi:hypothetical protein